MCVIFISVILLAIFLVINYKFYNYIIESENISLKPLIWDKKEIFYSKYNYSSTKITYTKNYTIYIHPRNDIISNIIKTSKQWFDCDLLPEMWDNIEDLNKNEGVFVDIGAHIGSCSLYMINEGIKTIAFEPVNENLYLFTKSLINNIKLVNDVEIYQCGLGNTTQELTMYINKMNIGESSIEAVPIISSSNISFENRLVKVFKLDDIWADKYDDLIINLLKLDVNGFELYVLQGAKKLLRYNKIISLYIEINCKCLSRYGVKSEDIFVLLEKYGYYIKDKQHCTEDLTYNTGVILNKYKK